MSKSGIIALTTKNRLFIRERKGSILGSLKPKERIKKEMPIQIGNLEKDTLKLLSLQIMLTLKKCDPALLRRLGKTMRKVKKDEELMFSFTTLKHSLTPQVRNWIS